MGEHVAIILMGSIDGHSVTEVLVEVQGEVVRTRTCTLDASLYDGCFGDSPAERAKLEQFARQWAADVEAEGYEAMSITVFELAQLAIGINLVGERGDLRTRTVVFG